MKSFLNQEYAIVYHEEADGGFTAFVPALPGCHTQGKTLDQVEDRIREAIAVYMESVKSKRSSIPKSTGRVFVGAVRI